jgi:hypothetical protein
MGDRKIGVTDEAPWAGVAEYRVRERAAGCEQYVIPISERVPSCKAMASTLSMSASAAGAPLAYLFNQTGSGVLVAVRQVLLIMTATSNTGTARGLITSRVTTEPTGGTAFAAVPFDTTKTSSASVVFKGGSSAEEGTTNLVATLGAPAWSQLQVRLASLYGQVLAGDDPIIPALSSTDPPILAPGQGFVFSYNPVDVPSSPQRHIVNAMWEEFTLP